MNLSFVEVMRLNSYQIQRLAVTFIVTLYLYLVIIDIAAKRD